VGLAVDVFRNWVPLSIRCQVVIAPPDRGLIDAAEFNNNASSDRPWVADVVKNRAQSHRAA
jgi:hypothetical protein